MMVKKLNLGCGQTLKKGYVNLDIFDKYGADVVFDLNKRKWNIFKDSEFDEVYCSHVLEHLDDPNNAMREIHRILKKGGMVFIRVPHFTSIYAFMDPTHKSFYSYFTFEYYVKTFKSVQYFDFAFEKIVSRKLKFSGGLPIWNRLIEPIANWSPRLYENSPLRSFPADEIHVWLKK